MAPIRTIAFIGVGQMGRLMAGHLVRAGYALRVHDRNPRAVAEFVAEHAASACDTPAQAARGAELLITMLPRAANVRAALLGRSGATKTLARGAVVIDMSSAEPLETRKLGERLAARGIELLDAPVSGSVLGAREARLTIMAGGDAAVLERARPVLEKLGARIFHAGALGTGHALKALNNYIAAAGTLAALEALLVASAFGIDPALMTEVCNASSGRNSTTENKIRQQILSGAFASGFSAALMAKDVGIAERLAREAGVAAPLARQTLRLWREAERALPPGADHTEIFRHMQARRRA